MLRRIAKLEGSRVLALDGEIGKVRDFYFDDTSWAVRYLIVDTGGWLSGRKVLISPKAVALIDRALHRVSLSLTRECVAGSPNIDTDKPVSRQHETEFIRYYGYPAYWGNLTQWAAGPMPPVAAPTASDLMELQERRLADELPGDTHLRSTQEVSGYAVNAIDGNFGRLRDFLFDDQTWAVDYLVIATGKWPFGRDLLVSRKIVRHVDWASRSAEVGLTREQIRQAAEIHTGTSPTRP